MLNLFITLQLALESLLNKRFNIKSQKGVTMIEYALIAALVSVVVIAILTLLGENIRETFTNISNAIQGANSSS